MTDMERVWAYGRIVRQIYDVGREIAAKLERYKHHCIYLMPKETDEEGGKK